MKSKSIVTILFVAALFLSVQPLTATTADVSQLIADTAKWESGRSPEPLRQLEQLVRDAVGKPEASAQLETALGQLLAPTATFEARRFACQQLAVIGTDASVPAIARLLKDHDTVGLACLAFGNRTSAKADQALRAALPAAKGQGRLQIITTLGNRRDAKAVPALAKLARDADRAVARTAIAALGRIANSAAAKVLAALRREATPPFHDSLADASLRCAEALAASGHRKAATAICEELLAPAQSAHVRRGAFTALLALDADGGQQRMLVAIRGADAVLQPVAIAAVASSRRPDTSETFGRELTSLSPQAQLWLINALAARGDAAARSAILGRLEAADAGVRLAAAAALGRVGGATVVKPLAKAIAGAKDANELRALQSALADLPGDRDTDKVIIAEIQNAQGEARARLIATLANRRSPEILAALFAEAEGADPLVVTAAYRVLAKAATGDALATLLKKYATLANPEIRSDLEAFAEQAVAATENVSVRSAAVREALALARGVEARCAVLSLLPAAGDAPALAALLAAVNGNVPQERDCSVYALSHWPDLAAWEAMYGIFRQPLNEAYRSLMLRSLVRLAGDANAQPNDQLIARYRELLAGARDAADLKQILGALGGAAHPEALKLATALLDNPAVRAEAEVAVKKISEALQTKPKS